MIPSRLTRGGDIKMAISSHWNLGRRDHLVHYVSGQNAVVVSFPVGKGEVVWWASDTPLTNAGIREQGNMELLLNSVGDRSQRVLWDEYFHGQSRGLWASVSDTPLRWALAQLGLLAATLLLTFSRRSGPVRPRVEESRLSPLEFVSTLGGLYHNAGAAQGAVEASYQRFRYLLTKRLALRPEIPAEELARAVRERLKFDDPDLARTLLRCEIAQRDTDLHNREAVALTQALSDLSRKLQLISPSHEEQEWKH